MSSMNVESYALAGDIALELSPVASDEPSRIVSHSSPKHHRSSCLFDDSKCHTSNISSSTDGAKPSSQAGDSVQGAAAERIQLQMPDFASMLPSECNFLESSADDATAPTPHTPVVLNVFEGEGLQACTSRTMQAAPWANSQEVDDEFHVDYDNMMPLDGSGQQEALQHLEHTHKEEGWLPALFPSLLSRRTLSAVMEGEHEGQEEEDQGQQQQQHGDCACEQQDQVLQQQRQQEQSAVLLHSREQGQGDESLVSSCSCSEGVATDAEAQRNGEAKAEGDSKEASAVAVHEFAIDESEVQLELCTSSVIVYADNPSVQQHQQQQQLQQCLQQHQEQCMQQPAAVQGTQQATPIAQHQLYDAFGQQLQQELQLQQQRDHQHPILDHRSKLDSLEAFDLPAVELRVSSRTADAGKGAAAAAGGGDTVQEEDEWQQANRLRMQELQQQALQSPTAVTQLNHQLTYPQAEAQLLAADMRCHRAAVLQSLPAPSGWFARYLHQLFSCGACSSSSSSSSSSAVALEGLNDQEQVVLLLSLAKTGLSDENDVHVGILNAVYSLYTGCPGPSARYGGHWCDVGFQGDDPATDLRGAGMLGLLQLMYLPYHDAAAAQKIHQLSISATQEFPLAVVGLNITRWSLTALRAGSLRRAAHKLGSYAAATNHFYCGAWYEFYTRWCQGKTMREAGFVLKHLEEYCRKHPARLLQLAAAPQKAMSAADSKAR